MERRCRYNPYARKHTSKKVQPKVGFTVTSKEWMFVADPCHVVLCDVNERNIADMVYQICIDPNNRASDRLLAYIRFKRPITKIGVKRKFPYLKIRKCFRNRGSISDALAWVDRLEDRRLINPGGTGVCFPKREYIEFKRYREQCSDV